MTNIITKKRKSVLRNIKRNYDLKFRRRNVKSMYRGWYISRDPFDKEKLRATKGNESITGTEEELQREIDHRAFEEMRRGK